MKTFLTLIRTALVMALIAAPSLAQEQSSSTTTSQVSPDSTSGSPAPKLSREEAEQLLRKTRVVVEQIVDGKDPEESDAPRARVGVAEPETEAERPSEARLVEILENALRQASRVTSAEMSAVLLRLLDAPSPSVRATALHWVAARADIREEALARALGEASDSLARTVALQMLLELGLKPEAVSEFSRLGDVSKSDLRQRLGALLRAVDR